MLLARAQLAACALALLGGAHAEVYKITEAEFYEMPPLFEMDHWEGCQARGGVYCVGSFELSPGERGQALFTRMQRYSGNWVDNFNHTRLHRALCASQRCGAPAHDAPLDEWFSSCVNASMSPYGLSSRLYKLDYCSGRAQAPPLTPAQQAFAALLVVLAALVALSTALDMMLSEHNKKEFCWALSWSLPACWSSLQAPARACVGADLRALDGLRVFCMWCVVIEHVCWLTSQAYISNVWQFEQMRRDADVMLITNSTLVVQTFFLMSSFLLAHKLLQQRRRGAAATLATFGDTMLTRVVRISPSYFVVVWFAATWWERLGSGPLWEPLVGAEAEVCRRKWWAQLLYLNNVLDADNKCLIQTWYLAADMQLYALSLALTLSLWRLRRGALYVLGALLVAAVLGPFAMAYVWHLVPTYVMHRPELVRQIYSGEATFNVMYQAPWSNAAGALAGLLLAHAHQVLVDQGVCLNDYKSFRYVSLASPYLALYWAAQSPRLLGPGPPSRAGAAALAALERPVFSVFVAIAILGAMHDVKSPLRTVLSWRGWAVPARLSFGVLLLHMPLNKALVASTLAPLQINRQIALMECFGISVLSCLCALPLALAVEYPAQRLERALRGSGPPREPDRPLREKTDEKPWIPCDGGDTTK